MKRILLVLAGAAMLAAIGCAPESQAQMVPGPAQAPTSVEVGGSGKCQSVRPGDIVHFSLTIEHVDPARAVSADLQMGTRHAVYRQTDLPMPGDGIMGGGGAGMHDQNFGKVYHFTFRVPPGAEAGVYRGLGVNVTVDDGSAWVDRHAREQVRRFCLAVFGNAENGPVVTDFHGGPIERH